MNLAEAVILFNRKIDRIEESITKRCVIGTEEEQCFYGTLEKDFKTFQNNSDDLEQFPSLKEYYLKKIDQIDELKEVVEIHCRNNGISQLKGLIRLKNLRRQLNENIKRTRQDIEPNQAPKPAAKLTFILEAYGQSDIKTIYKTMIKTGIIDKNSDYKTVESLFAGKQGNGNYSKLALRKKTLYVYLINELFRLELIQPSQYFERWSISKLCFKNAQNLKTLSKQYQDNKKNPRGSDKIDMILNKLSQKSTGI